jgi:GlpG protein
MGETGHGRTLRAADRHGVRNATLRQIGTLEQEDVARLLADHLLTLGVATQLRKEAAGWGVWVLEEDRIDAAAKELEAFRANPDDPRFRAATRTAEAIRRDSQRRDQEYRKNFHMVSDAWSGPQIRRRPLTFGLIVVCFIVYLLIGHHGRENGVRDALAFAVDHQEVIDGRLVVVPGSVDGILHGEVWRLVTPIFMHFGIIHLLFDMWALAALGTIIEYRRGTRTLALLVLVSAIASNLGEYLWMMNSIGHAELFGGMSGVAYALFGYIWMKGENEPEQGMILHPSTVQIMLLWLVACMLGFVGNIANAAHVVGLLVGVACGLARV